MESTEDLTEIEYDNELPFIKKVIKGKVVEVRQVSTDYVLEEFEKKADLKDYEKYYEKKLKETMDKAIVKPKILKIDSYLDNAEIFWKHQPFFYDSAGMFWFWKDNKYEQVDDVDVMNKIDEELGFMGQTINSRIKSNYLEALKRVGRKHRPKDAYKRWIQFKDKAVSLRSGKIHNVTHDYFFTNPIPWEIGKTEETPVMDKLIKEWVGERYVTTAYEMIAYCCYADYPIHLVFCLVGCGRNGKSKFLGMINKFIGRENICSTELDILLDSRFESFKLYKKLVCTMGETNFGVMKKTSLLKKLTGQDMIGFEFKNKKPFDDYNYAKIIISSNSLPTTADTSEGFFRRWLILDFPNIFPEGKDILNTIPKEEYNNLAKKVVGILPRLLDNSKFTNQGSIETRKKRYIMASNPLVFFIKVCCNVGEEEFYSYNELYTAYTSYLRQHKKRKVKMVEFKSALQDEGFWVEKTSKKVGDDWKSGYWVEGVSLRFDWKEHICDNLELCDTTLPQHPPIGNQGKKGVKLSQKSQKNIEEEQIQENIAHKCSICGHTESHYWNERGKPICKDCKGAKDSQGALK